MQTTVSIRRGISPSWRLPAALLVVLLAVLAASSFRTRQSRSTAGLELSDGWSPTPAAAGDRVALVIDFGNGAQRRFECLAWHAGMTVDDLMSTAARFRPAIRYGYVGSGKTAFLTHVDGLHNEGADGRNWQFWVNGERGDRSFAMFPLEPGDSVLWKFAEFE
jgi:hypothetical protein